MLLVPALKNMTKVKDINGKTTPLQVANEIPWDRAGWVVVVWSDEHGNTLFRNSEMSTVELNSAAMDLQAIVTAKIISRMGR